MAISLSTGLRNKLLDTTGNNFADIFNTARIAIYSGTVPADADAAITGTLLVTITSDDGVTTPNLDWATAASGAMTKGTGVWSGVIANTGTATHWRLYNNADGAPTGSSTTYARVQGTIGTSGADGNLSSTSLTATNTQYIDYFSIGIPAS
jgi:hypothetical protein